MVQNDADGTRDVCRRDRVEPDAALRPYRQLRPAAQPLQQDEAGALADAPAGFVAFCDNSVAVRTFRQIRLFGRDDFEKNAQLRRTVRAQGPDEAAQLRLGGRREYDGTKTVDDRRGECGDRAGATGELHAQRTRT